jgi:hypothetical protein
MFINQILKRLLLILILKRLLLSGAVVLAEV